MRRLRARGLSIVELLVTLVLVALTVSLVIGGIGQGGALLARVAADQGAVYEELMARAWLRQTLASAVSPAAGESGLAGSAQELRLLTFRPLLGSEGIPTSIEWRAARGRGLVYVEGAQQIAIETLPVVARFEYQDATQAWHEQWPVDDEKPGLPARVRVVFEDADDSVDVALLTRQEPVPDAEDAEFDSE